jgi:hypothetical protein
VRSPDSTVQVTGLGADTLDRAVAKLVPRFNERDLHPLLVRFVNGHEHFHAFALTIYHEESAKKAKGQYEWLFPDLVGVYLPFKEYEEEVLKVQQVFQSNPVKLFSFELKINLNFGNLREYYFQAVSNSSWANEGYLVALNIDTNPDFVDDLRRLNNAFGIGIIELNLENVDESEILFPARLKEQIDWDTVNRLCEANPKFKELLSVLSRSVPSFLIHKELYDPVLDDQQLEQCIKDKHIIKNVEAEP